MTFDEREYYSELRKNNIEKFLKMIEKLDDELMPQMKLQGWKYRKRAEKTVTFSLGVVTYRRRSYSKDGVWRYPVDEELGIVKYGRYSPELLYQIADYATSMPLRQVSAKFEVSAQLYIGKSTVHSTTNKVSKLFDDREEYRYFEENEMIDKIKAQAVYIEGDGVMLKTQEKERVDMAHFLVHTGSEQISGNRYRLKDKSEIISSQHAVALDQLEDLLTNRYDITSDTVLITNSDMGKGYTPYIFKEIASLFQCRHEHFWDAQHLNMKIKERFRKLPYELEQRLFSAIQLHSKKSTRVILDTAESLINNEEELELFNKFKIKLLQNFQYTKPAELRGFSHRGIGVMETQHRKLTYRMKRRGMYWSEKGANTMSKMILAVYNDSLRELFFGAWREEYAYYQKIDIPVGEFFRQDKTSSINEMNRKTTNNITARRKINRNPLL
ncbi:ISLre2 family transposase [Lactococcus lactis]|uniref:ISLre2 family transposase n=1 Tax=Lactococcus lactis TaxID=1358 RepID=A0AAW8UKJ2_9LACT|nr:ISLre2 family transposase [Lactococcus lactis]MCB6852956.1 ISLre2 family transposase [Lactococcus lactis]MDT2881882.1 ISLre2 family transposase [Lactococcus lactis]MDT2882871.1 ISLre2 family transposase [Lactococcus lactis]MDT2899880.1 ISLre2 family transposase [Lactococcus lactis]MDT2903447.1 ISLre2 family transposase [Lactococcus lactis]